MNTFIGESVKFLCEKYREDISNINVLLPSKRSQLFFNIELSSYFKSKPIWQPKFISMDSLCQDITGLKIGSKIKLLIELFNIYKKFHKEDFDHFYHWGEMLLSDFDAIDNYKINAKEVFCNISDLYEIDAIYDDIAQEQKQQINNFWSIFSGSKKSSEKDSFMNIWNTLHEIYSQFKKHLSKINIGYKGMIYRKAAEMLQSQPENMFKGKNYAIIGFNALSNSEKIIFDKIKNTKTADFFWDFDQYYITNRRHEAGTFIRENISRYGDSIKAKHANYTQPKQINVINTPSDAMQCKYVWDFLDSCSENGTKTLSKETAIILTDETLLLPVLYSIPQQVTKFNITAGYPVSQTPAYTLFEYLIKLFINSKAGGETIKIHKETALTILRHPIVALSTQQCDEKSTLAKELENDKTKFIQYLSKSSELLNAIFEFNPKENISEYLFKALNQIGQEYYKVEKEKINLEFMYQVVQEIERTNNIFQQTNFTPSNNIYVSAIRKHLQATTIPFLGEPLIGVQIMGILETRNIDFENVLILSMNDDNYPSSSVRRSFIPHALRSGHGLPTYSHQEAMYTYYFYRLVQRAKRVDIAYCSSSEGVKSGEMSRYMYQMKYEKTHLLNEVNLSLNVNIEQGESTISKTNKYREFVAELTSKAKKISPSAIDDWINCQARFYYKYILKIKVKQKVETSLSNMDFGSAVHDVLEVIYKTVINMDNNSTKSTLGKYLIDDKLIEIMVNSWISAKAPEIEDLGATATSKKFIISYVKSIINFDINRVDEFIVTGIEQSVDAEITLDNGITVGLYGKIDRIDSGARIDIITDYKTGSVNNKAPSIESLFDRDSAKINKPFLQSLIYCYMYKQSTGRNVYPSIYSAKEMQNKDYNNKLMITEKSNKYTIDSIDMVSQEIESQLKTTIAEMTNTTSPIEKCNNQSRCEYCDYRTICMK